MSKYYISSVGVLVDINVCIGDVKGVPKGNGWFFYEGVESVDDAHYVNTIVNKTYVLKNPSLECDKFPKTFEQSFLSDNEYMYSLLEFYDVIVTEKTVKKQVQLQYCGEIPASIAINPYDPKLYMPNVKDDSKKIIFMAVDYHDLVKQFIEVQFRHNYPCTIPSVKWYNIIREYVKENINPKVAHINSDYNFCFDVSKIIAPPDLPLKVSVVDKKNVNLKPNKITHSVFKMTSSKDKYNGYPILDDLHAENLEDMKQKVVTYLTELMNLINTPLTSCPHCKGAGVLL